jgi:hypothetical protein
MQAEPLTLQQRLQGLAVFLPLFEKPGFRFGSWEDTDGNPIADCMYSKVAADFIDMAYDFEWVRMDFAWPSWKETKEATDLRDDPEIMKRATVEDLSKLLTVVIRQDRFCEGSLADAFESGLITAICRRAAQIEAEYKGSI